MNKIVPTEQARASAIAKERRFRATHETELLVSAAEDRIAAGDMDVARAELEGLLELAKHDPASVSLWSMDRIQGLLRTIERSTRI